MCVEQIEIKPDVLLIDAVKLEGTGLLWFRLSREMPSLSR